VGVTGRPPLIGIVAHRAAIREPSGPATHHVVDSAYIKAVRKAGGRPVLIPLVEDGDAPELIERMDGILLTGGDDVDPSRYGQPTAPQVFRTDPVRDGWDIASVRAVLAIDRPLLAVCRGVQVLNVALGGSLVQHIEGHSVPEGYNRSVHQIGIEAGSSLSEWLGAQGEAGHLGVNSLHHQAVARLGDGLYVSARAEDGTIEALGLEGCPGVLGVQWHPELLRHRPDHLILFQHLVARSAGVHSAA
jgi:putative glutamine amidotransferase